MKAKSSKQHDETRIDYWKNLIENFSSQSKVWLEGFEVNDEKKSAEKCYLSESIKFSPALITRFKKFSQEHKIPATALIHAAWGLLLNRYSGTDDTIYGLAWYTEEASKKTETKIIYNPILPMRSTLHEDDTILAYLNNINTTLEKNQEHVDSFDHNAKQNEIFKSLLTYLLLSPLEKKGQKNGKKVGNFQPLSENLDPATYPLILKIKKIAKLEIEMLFCNIKFTRRSAANLAQHFVVILEKILSDCQQPVTHFSILTKKEKQELLHDWNKPQYQRVFKREKDFIHDLFTKQAQKFPDNLAAKFQNTSLTYKQLEEASNQIAHMLLHRKVRAGDAVAVFMERTPAILAVMLAIFKVGAIYVPISPKYPDDRIQFILDDCNTHLIIVNNTHRIRHDLIYKTLLIDDNYTSVKTLPKQHPVIQSNRQDLVAYIIYTSGTTGQPKGVMIKHESLVNLVNWYKSNFAIKPQDRSVQFASQGFDTFFCETIPYLAVGASVHIIDDNSKLTPSVFLPWLAAEKITVADLPVAYAQILFALPWPDNIHMRLLKIGGESVLHYPNQKFSFDIWNGYGPTEATVEATYYKIFHANIEPKDQPITHYPPPIGKPITGCEVYVVDQHMEPVPVGSVGELLIGGVVISSGYLNRPELTREKFIRNIFSTDPNAKLYRTGDLVRWLDDGNLEYIGRIDHQVKIRGYRIELSEIESALVQYPDVNEVVVLAKELITGQKTLIAYLVPNMEKLRIPYQERCLVALNDLRYLQVLTEDFSREGIAVSGLSEMLEIGTALKLEFKLPGTSEGTWLSGKLIWQVDQRAGIKFDTTEEQTVLLNKAVEFFLSTHNLMDTLQSAGTKRSLRKALRKKLPEYMIPSIFSVLPQFPLTFNGKIDSKALPPPQDFERLLERSNVPPRNETEKAIAEIWADILNQKQISITDNFFDLGGNSLTVSQLSVKILQKFNISIPAKIFFDLPFIPVIAEYIDSNGKQYTMKSSIQEEINRDSVLQDELVPTNVLSKHLDNPQGILLTGASGFLGIYLLRELLRQTEAKIYCLVRKGEFESVAKRFMANIDRYELGEEISLANRRIVIIAADIGLDQFGIPHELYNNLTEKVDVIYHCGAQVNTMAAYTNLRTSNVQGTIEVIKFALQKFDKPIHYISTLSAAYKTDEKGNFSEEFPDGDYNKLTGGYAVSKWVSERLLTQIKERGLPVCIYRSGYILGQSDTGITNMNDALLLLMKGCIQLGYAPNWKEKVMLLPVDFVSDAVVEIAMHHPTKSGVFHLDHPTGIMWTDLIAWLNNYGYNIKTCSHKEWLNKLSTITASNALYPFLPHYLSQINEPKTPGTGMENTRALLREIKLHYPEIDDALLQIYMQYLCHVGFFPMPQGRKKQITV